MEFIQEDSVSPFFAYVATNTPHGPFNVHTKYVDTVNDAVPEKLGHAVLGYLDNPGRGNALREEFARLHKLLRCGANERAAEAVLELVARDLRRTER